MSLDDAWCALYIGYFDFRTLEVILGSFGPLFFKHNSTLNLKTVASRAKRMKMWVAGEMYTVYSVLLNSNVSRSTWGHSVQFLKFSS